MFWSNLSNPHSNLIKKYLYEILKEKYIEHEKFIDRICSTLAIQEDAQEFVKIIGDVYQKGYVLAVDQHKEALAKIGMSVKITSGDKSENKIFNQKNQAD